MPTVAGEAVREAEAMAGAGLPVYLAGSSFALPLFRQNAPGIALDATMRDAAAMLTAGHTTALPARTPLKATRRGAAAGVARAVAVAREVQAAEAARSVISTRDAAGVASVAREAVVAASVLAEDRTQSPLPPSSRPSQRPRWRPPRRARQHH